MNAATNWISHVVLPLCARRTVALAVTCVSLCSCAAGGGAPASQPNSRLEISDLTRSAIERLVREHDVPGIAVAVVSNGSVSDVETFGFRDRENSLPLTRQTVMAGMSWTKFVFAAYVADLAAEGRINLDRPIGDYLTRPLPDYGHYADLSGDHRLRKLTLRLLLSHRSGLPNFRFYPPKSDLDRDAPLAFFREPGETYGYSGEGFQIAQLVVEEALGINIATEVEKRFFDRLGLERTGLAWKDRFASDFDIAYGENGQRLGHDKRERFDAAGSMNTSIADFAAFVAAFMRGDAVSPEARTLVLTPQAPIRSAHQFPPWSEERNLLLGEVDLAAGLGVVLWEGRQGRGFFKGGHDNGGDNMLVCLIDRRKCVLLMMNIPKGHLVFPQIVESVLGPTELPWKWEYAQLAN